MRKRCDRPDDSTSHHNSHLTDRREHSHAGGAFFKCLNLCWSLRLPPVSIYSSSQTEESWRDLFCVLRSFFTGKFFAISRISHTAHHRARGRRGFRVQDARRSVNAADYSARAPSEPHNESAFGEGPSWCHCTARLL